MALNIHRAFQPNQSSAIKWLDTFSSIFPWRCWNVVRRWYLQKKWWNWYVICNDTQRLVMMADRSFPYMIRQLIVVTSVGLYYFLDRKLYQSSRFCPPLCFPNFGDECSREFTTKRFSRSRGTNSTLIFRILWRKDEKSKLI